MGLYLSLLVSKNIFPFWWADLYPFFITLYRQLYFSSVVSDPKNECHSGYSIIVYFGFRVCMF